MRLCLTQEELIEVTHKRQPAAQERALRKMGLECKRRADGSVLVDRHDYEFWLGGERRRKAKPARWEPTWDNDNVAA